MKLDLSNLSDEELLASLDALCTDLRRIRVQALRDLVDAQRDEEHVRQGYPSMLDLCVRHYGMDEDDATEMLDAARAIAREPDLFDRYDRGELQIDDLILMGREPIRGAVR